jgi:hypothetical protein
VSYGAPTLNSSLRRGIINGAFSSGGFGTAIASFDLLDRSFAVGVPNEASAARFVPAGTALPASPVFVYSLAGRPDFGRSIAGIW